MVVLRDFPDPNPHNTFFHERGFIKVNMPEACVFEDFSWNTTADFPTILSKKSRRHFYKDVEAFKDRFEVVIQPTFSEKMLDNFHHLYENVRKNNPGLNTFPFPEKLFLEMNKNKNWEFLVLNIKAEYSQSGDQETVGVMFCYNNSNTTYVPSFVGMDYNYNEQFSIYRQLLFQTILRAKELGVQQIDFGLTAAFEKRKLGAIVIPKVCYVQAKDNFSLELLETMQNSR